MNPPEGKRMSKADIKKLNWVKEFQEKKEFGQHKQGFGMSDLPITMNCPSILEAKVSNYVLFLILSDVF